jgi:hypothetical protein
MTFQCSMPANVGTAYRLGVSTVVADVTMGFGHEETVVVYPEPAKCSRHLRLYSMHNLKDLMPAITSQTDGMQLECDLLYFLGSFVHFAVSGTPTPHTCHRPAAVLCKCSFSPLCSSAVCGRVVQKLRSELCCPCVACTHCASPQPGVRKAPQMHRSVQCWWPHGTSWNGSLFQACHITASCHCCHEAS